MSQTSFGNQQPKTAQASITVKTETANKIGLFGAIGVIIGAVIGVGIFFKNGSVFKNNNGNAWGVLISWIMALVIALATAYSYGEISRAKTKVANSGLSGWSERYVGYKFSRFIKLDYPLFYYSIYLIAMSTFLSEAIFNIFTGSHPGSIQVDFGWIVLVAVALTVFFLMLNLLTETLATKMSSYLSLVKFLPIAIVIVAGFVCGGIHPDHNLFAHPGNVYGHPEYSGTFDFTGVLNSLPAILFAFDSFLIVGNVSSSVKNPEKNIPLSVVLSMCISGGLYLFIVIAQICCGCGTPYDLTACICGTGTTGAKVFNVILSILLFIAVFGCVNSVTLASVRSAQAAIDEEVVCCSGWFKKVSNGRRSKLYGGVLLIAMLQIFWFLIGSIAGIVLQTDQIVDGLSNQVVTFFYLIYGFLPFMNILKNKVSTEEVPHQKLRKTTAIIAFVGCSFIVLWSMCWTFLGNVIVHPNDNSSWGLFFDLSRGTDLSNAAACGVFWGTAALFFAFPFINDLIIKLTNKTYNQPLLWEKVIAEPKITNAPKA